MDRRRTRQVPGRRRVDRAHDVGVRPSAVRASYRDRAPRRDDRPRAWEVPRARARSSARRVAAASGRGRVVCDRADARDRARGRTAIRLVALAGLPGRAPRPVRVRHDRDRQPVLARRRDQSTRPAPAAGMAVRGRCRARAVGSPDRGRCRPSAGAPASRAVSPGDALAVRSRAAAAHGRDARPQHGLPWHRDAARRRRRGRPPLHRHAQPRGGRAVADRVRRVGAQSQPAPERRVRRAPPRRRQDPHPEGDHQQARQARRVGVGADAQPHDRRRADARAGRRTARERRTDRARDSRALRRQRLSGRSGWRGDPRRGPDRVRLRRVQRDDDRSFVSEGDAEG